MPYNQKENGTNTMKNTFGMGHFWRPLLGHTYN